MSLCLTFLGEESGVEYALDHLADLRVSIMSENGCVISF